MVQQINLFNPAFVPRLDLLRARYMLCHVGVALVLAIAGASWARWHASQVLRQEQALNAQIAALRGEVDQLSVQLGARKTDTALEAQLDHVQRALKSKQRVVRWLESEGMAETAGVSEYFRALARQTLAGVWLTRFHLSNAGQHMRIEGRSLRADLIPRYLELLGAEQALKGRAFSTVALEPAQAVEGPLREAKVVAFQFHTVEPSGVRPVEQH